MTHTDYLQTNRAQETLTEHERITYVGRIQRTPQWYIITYAIRDNTGEYFTTQKFYNPHDAIQWRRDALAIAQP